MTPRVITVKQKFASKLTIIPGACIHWPLGDQALLKRWVNRIKELDCYSILMGDSADWARSKFREHVKRYTGDNDSRGQVDEWARTDLNNLCRILEPIKHKILGCIDGNHLWEFPSGITTENYIADQLGIRYLGKMGIIRIQNGNQHVNIFAHHTAGSKGGRTKGGDVNAVDRMEQIIDADMYLAAHTHDLYSYPKTRFEVSSRSSDRVLRRDRIFSRVGSFLDYHKYAEEAGYPPRPLGWIENSFEWYREGSAASNRVRERRARVTIVTA